MTRKEFVKICALLGIGLPLQTKLSSCSDDSVMSSDFDGKVIIIGAGAGGLTAGYLLAQMGIEFEMLEASAVYGGRMKRNNTFTDFPIPLGSEWIHVNKSILNEIVNDTSINIETMTTGYDYDVDYALFEGMQLSLKDIGFDGDLKFIGSSWFDFYERYIVPSVAPHISYNTVVSDINYSGDTITVSTPNQEFTCDKLIVSVPVKMLQNNTINFTPALPDRKQTAIRDIPIWDGCKAFIEFEEKFYPTIVAFDIQPETDGEKLYYDAAYGQNSQKHVLGLFAVGTGTLPYVNLEDEELIQYMLNELDALFDGKASAHYIQHTFQNWNEEPYINGAYISSHANWRDVRTLGESIDNKVYFAGTGYTTGNDWSSVHTAARSTIRAVDELT